MARPMPRFWSGVQQERVGTCRLDTYGASHNDYLGITHDMSTDIDGIAKKAALGTVEASVIENHASGNKTAGKGVRQIHTRVLRLYGRRQQCCDMPPENHAVRQSHRQPFPVVISLRSFIMIYLITHHSSYYSLGASCTSSLMSV